jgi:DNA-binding HxlR family transcriptional regulator
MRRASFEDMNCSIARSLEVIGEWWTLLILRDVFLGVTRFEQFQARLGIARNILTNRLDKLVAEGVLERRVYDEARQRADYVLTDKGRALWPIIVTIRQWGDEWILGEGRQPVELLHKSCGHRSIATLVCDHCGEALEARAVRAVPGPGSTDPSILVRPAERAGATRRP